MTKKFSLLQLFSVADGRLSTSMDDVYDMLNHVCDTDLMTHHLPIAFQYLKDKNPEWLQKIKEQLNRMGITKETPFDLCIDKIKRYDMDFDIPQLKDTCDTSDFGDYMVNHSLLNKIGTNV